MEQYMHYLPMVAYGLCGLGVVYLLITYKRKHDLRDWLNQLRHIAAKASENEAYRKEKLAEAETELAKYPVPESISPVQRKHEAYLQMLPKFMFVVGSCGVFLLFMGLFRPHPEGTSNWEIYVGPACLLFTAYMYFFLERIRPNYARVQQMNCKYLLQKAGNDPESLGTLCEILEYYPGVPQLWMEKADALANDNKLDDAIDAIRHAVALAPQNIDLNIVEVAFHLRKGAAEDAEKALDTVWNLKKAPTDPRPDIYAAAIALRRGDEEKALKHGEKAAELDKDFLERFFPRDEALKEIEKFLKVKKVL